MFRMLQSYFELTEQLAACASGLVAGILGLTNFYGFALYILTALASAITVAVIKCDMDIGKCVPQAHGVTIGAGPVGVGGGGVVAWKGWWALAGLGQENLLGFLLFWIGSYALIHGQSRLLVWKSS